MNRIRVLMAGVLFGLPLLAAAQALPATQGQRARQMLHLVERAQPGRPPRLLRRPLRPLGPPGGPRRRGLRDRAHRPVGLARQAADRPVPRHGRTVRTRPDRRAVAGAGHVELLRDHRRHGQVPWSARRGAGRGRHTAGRGEPDVHADRRCRRPGSARLQGQRRPHQRPLAWTHAGVDHSAISTASSRCGVSHQGTSTSPRLADACPPASTSA